MEQSVWTKVDDYFSGLWMSGGDALPAALAACDAAGLPAISVSPEQGHMLHLLARIRGAKHILEIGTLGGYSTIWLAKALPEGGRVVTLECDPACAAVATANFKRAGVDGNIRLVLGDATETLPALPAAEPFDLIFIDADKQNNPFYLQESLRLTRAGAVIIVDNIVRKGAVVDADSEDLAVQGVRRFAEMAAAEPRLDAAAVQTVGCKGYDGFALMLVTS